MEGSVSFLSVCERCGDGPAVENSGHCASCLADFCLGCDGPRDVNGATYCERCRDAAECEDCGAPTGDPEAQVCGPCGSYWDKVNSDIDDAKWGDR